MPLNHGDRKTVNRIAPTGRRFPLRFAPWPLTAGSGSSGMLSIGARVQEDTHEREVLMVEAHGAASGMRN